MLGKISYWILKLFGLAFILWMIGLLLALSGFTRFTPLLNVFGIHVVGERGILINCTRQENQKNEFCMALAKRAAQKKTGSSANSESRLGEVEKGPGIPFNLSN